jgi:hypothetical protein
MSSTSASFSAFGLSLRANRPIPGLRPRSAGASVDTHILLDPETWAPAQDSSGELQYVSAEHDEHGPLLQVWRLAGGTYYRLLYSEGIEFLVDRRGTEVWARWSESLTVDDAATFLLGPVLGFVLRLRGTVCLHASAVAVGERAVALLGPAGVGKSTTAAAFSRMGYSVLADDIVALLERGATWHVQPAYPQLRLWPDSVALLYDTVDALPRLTPGWDKRALDLTRSDCRFCEQPLPLSAIYVLPHGISRVAPHFHTLGGRESLLTLLANTYVSYLLDVAMRGEEFQVLSRVISSVPVRLVPAPAANGGSISELCSSIANDCEALGCTVSPTTVR